MANGSGAGRRVPVVGFVGPSGVGKTTLVERMIPALRRRGLVVAAVKHASHGFLADRPGKDSYRLYESGADAVALISGEQVATFRRRAPAPGEPEVSLEAALRTLPPGLDLALAEGFSWEEIPRVVLFRDGGEPMPDHLARGPVLELVSVPEPAAGRPPTFSALLVEALVERVLGCLDSATRPSDEGRSRGPDKAPLDTTSA